jgi:hypothetical protein
MWERHLESCNCCKTASELPDCYTPEQIASYCCEKGRPLWRDFWREKERNERKLRALEVQKMLGVKDEEIICHGYSPTNDMNYRLTYDIWFKDGKLIKAGYRLDGTVEELYQSERFESDFFFDNIKRWYKDTVNPKLLALMQTFNNGLSTTPGGFIPTCLPDITTTKPNVNT